MKLFVAVLGEVVAAGPNFTLGGFLCHVLVSGDLRHQTI